MKKRSQIGICLTCPQEKIKGSFLGKQYWNGDSSMRVKPIHMVNWSAPQNSSPDQEENLESSIPICSMQGIPNFPVSLRALGPGEKISYLCYNSMPLNGHWVWPFLLLTTLENCSLLIFLKVLVKNLLNGKCHHTSKLSIYSGWKKMYKFKD